jgi:GntR family transcriptional regulator
MVPIYMKVKDDLLEKIYKDEYKSGDKIPSERLLAEIYHVSRMTARQAINELVKNGAVIRKQGSGTYVSGPQFFQQNVRSFTETIKDQGYNPSTEVLEFSRVHHIKPISEMLGYSEETIFYKLKRIRLGNNIPIALETVYFPEEKCPGLKDFSKSQSLYKLLYEQFGYSVEQISYDIDACISNRMMMKYFKVNSKIALLKISGVNYTKNLEPLMYEESYYRPDLYKYKIDVYNRI